MTSECMSRKWRIHRGGIELIRNETKKKNVEVEGKATFTLHSFAVKRYKKQQCTEEKQYFKRHISAINPVSLAGYSFVCIIEH